MNNPWERIDQPFKEASARRVDPVHPLDLFWGHDSLGHYLFIFEFSSEEVLPKIHLPDLVGIKSAFFSDSDQHHVRRFILLLNDKHNWEIFLSLCSDLVEATRYADTPLIAVQTIINRLEHWQEFLKNKRSEILSEEEILGLIGELLFIKKYLIPVFGVDQSIKFWQGPEGLPQDFNVSNCAVEIKTRSGSTTPYIKISSVDQLCPQLPEMYLQVFTLGITILDDPGSINLPELIYQIRDALRTEASGQTERFNDLLHSIGYFDSDRYLDFNYVLVDEKMFQVTDGFPRVCSKDLHRGIKNLTYSISLLECASFEKQPYWILEGK
jgi:hypothetical protein